MKKTTNLIFVVFCFVLIATILSLTVNAQAAHNPTVTVDGMVITVTDVSDAAVVRTAVGVHDTVSSMKAAGAISHTQCAIKFFDEYSYDMNAVGDATVVVEYDDGSAFWFHVYLTGEPVILEERNPQMTLEGSIVTISGLTDVKVVRIAPGNYGTSQDIKLADGCVNYTQDYIGGIDTRCFPITTDGDISVAVQYTDGQIIILNTGIVPEKEPILPTEHYPTVSADGLKVTVGGLEDVYTIRVIDGHYDVPVEVRNHPDAVNYGQSLIRRAESYTFTWPNAGEITVVVQYNDVTRYLFNLILTEKYDPEVSANGTSVKVSALIEARDIFIAKGHYDSYRQVNDNKLVHITESKLNGAEQYTYAVREGGEHTVAVRYHDGSVVIRYVHVEVTEPSFTQDGLKLTVSNLDGVKVIRTAAGVYDTAAKIKNAEGSRAFTANVINGVDEYTVQYRENGPISISVSYHNGYTVVKSFDIARYTPSFTQDKSTVRFGDLEGLQVLRYAKGEYTTSRDIKYAAGSVALTYANVVDGYITVELERGTYTFCVQYEDESYNFYRVTVSENEKITPEAAKALMDTEENYIILDVRTLTEYNDGHIPGAILIPNTELADRASNELPDKDQLILLYCRSGSRSAQAAQTLAELGYTNVKDFGGISSWPYEIV